ncbi:putative l-psp endoribonuclease family protein [Eutypa lata UCREL1]|uniref:Putative l-psp endoribonuclease family protein n=1 Tax=Eutypa lata (strain UCR-EL1) TaxID=1287681 RepID=M7TN71_EUTLA|nr:putative l-psp endoribonuclease family protein [Eutypa lata UCREL1]
MAGLQTYSYPGIGEWAKETMSYSQAIRVENRIVCEPTPCGRPRLEQVYRVTTYSTDLKATHDHVVRNYRRWMPGHQPTWTEVGVKELGLDTMHFEIEVEALDPEGAAVAAAAAKVEGKA